MEGENITKRQKEILEFLYQSIRENGFPPTLEEFNQQFGFRSNQAIIDHLAALEKKKLIKRDGGSARGIFIRPLGYEAIKKEPLIRNVGVSAAGPAIQAIEQNEWLSMPSGFKKYEDVFIVEISGNSMVEIGIYDGDHVLIKKANEYKNGDIVLARIGDEVTLKTFTHKDGRAYLKPENPACRDIAITHDTYFLGKFIKNLS
ncbi:repressor LexA [Candidatus Berkelbacteria bacterium CG10_big_fil_rev_8_21_14_0_10_41_12]|uniref:Repressor LexA n=1 Tax=Candidatus Berkelbacteria bacterium CG10_big_fil_rev_8_21_14_0_10_41_12 TaxID=1974513 RepID=A0A2M6WX73_9BACT|nr:MAG: repressor LexA [Candidatus Berkelbacteria bacterium CG10_big_fil_rev_8_21_14_0_10_41_12]